MQRLAAVAVVVVALVVIVVIVVIVVSVLAACSGDDRAAPDDPTDPAAVDAPNAGEAEGADAAGRPALLATSLEELVTEDNTFGDGPPPFTEYLIQSHFAAAADAGSPGSDEADAPPLTMAEREAIEAAIRPLGPVRWIEDPADGRTSDLAPTTEGAAILGVGEPTVQGDHALVPVSMSPWCGGLCATWLTYRLDLVDGTWQVSGTEGPVAIA